MSAGAGAETPRRTATRVQGAGRLTLEDLRRDVPIYQDGQRAHFALLADPANPDRRKLLRVKAEGEKAKERLVLAAIPLIKMLAAKEHRRRQNWHSQVTFEDLMQEGVYGFLRGLMAYNPHGSQKSPTNYLGQWIMTEMRRNSEGLDNDFGVAFDAAERHRRIRALRSRLTTDLGREPTDDEVIAASTDPAYATGQKIGRINKPANSSRQLTHAQLAEEAALRSRVGYTARLAADGDDEHPGPIMDFARPLHDANPGDAADPVVDRGVQAALAALLIKTMNQLGMPSVQRDIIARNHALPPYQREESARDISRALNVHRERIGRVLDAFRNEMQRPGGAFHHAVSDLSIDELADLNLSWVTARLGDYNSLPSSRRTQPAPDVLTQPLITRKVRADDTDQTDTSQVRVEYTCPTDGCRFVAVYRTADEADLERSCPFCQRLVQHHRIEQLPRSADTKDIDATAGAPTRPLARATKGQP